MRNSSRSSTSSTFRQLLAASIKMRSLSMLASGAWATQFASISICLDSARPFSGTVRP
jgi:hypothetical protein